MEEDPDYIFKLEDDSEGCPEEGITSRENGSVVSNKNSCENSKDRKRERQQTISDHNGNLLIKGGEIVQ